MLCVNVKPTPVPQVPRLPHKTKVDVTKCHACHVKRPRMSGSARLPRKTAPGLHGAQAHHQTQPSLISAMPATQNEGGCRQVPRLPREAAEIVTKCHACHAKGRGTARRPSASPDPAQSHKCHACHAKRRWMSPSATPAR